MEILFCARCGVRLTDEQFRTGEALRTPDEHAYCHACLPAPAPAPAPSVSSAASRPPSVRVATPPGRKSSARFVPVRKARRRSSRRTAPVLASAAAGGAVSARRGAVPVRPSGAGGIPAAVWLAGGSVGGILISLALVFALEIGASPARTRAGGKPQALREGQPTKQPVERSGLSGPREIPFPKVGRHIFEANFDRLDLGGFGGQDFEEATAPYALADPSRPGTGGVLALGTLARHPRYALGTGVDLPAERLVARRLRLRFRYRLQCRKAALAVALTIETPQGLRRYRFEAADATRGPWRWFDEPLMAFQAQAADPMAPQRLILLAGAAGDKTATAAYVDDVLLYEAADTGRAAPR